MTPNVEDSNIPSASEKRFSKAAFLNDPSAPEFAEVRQAILKHLRAKQEAVDRASAASVIDNQEQSATKVHEASQTLGGRTFESRTVTCNVSQKGCCAYESTASDQRPPLATPVYIASTFLLNIAGIGLILPLALVAMPVIALAIKATSKGPIFSKVLRVGRKEQPFLLYRFRTTWITLEPNQAYGAHLDDIATTPLGVLLRNTKLERLPEIINIIKGNTSMVGPRARHPWFTRFMTSQQRLSIFSVRPGLIGPVQLRFRYERRLMACQPDKLGYFLRVLMPLQLRAEEEYIQRRSIYQDLQLVMWMWRVTCRNFGSRNRQVLKDWLDQGGQTKALVGKTLPSDRAVQEFYPQNSACMYTRRWEQFAANLRH